MEQGRASLTARIVSTARRVANAPKPLARAANLATLGLVDHVALRAKEIDAALRDARAEQVVILGAGFDDRADRMPELAGVPVFEVDHPATQAIKRKEHPDTHATHVAIDFEKERIQDALAHAGHDASRSTFFVWEGVTPYLQTEAVRAGLEDIAARSAPGSRAIISYGTKEGFLLPRPAQAVAYRLLRSFGEPLLGLTTREAFAGLVAGAGLQVLADTGAREWAARAGASLGPLFLIAERLVLTEKVNLPT